MENGVHIFFLFPGGCCFCCCSVTQSCPTLCDSMDGSVPGFRSFTISRSLLKLMSTVLMMSSNHLILCRPLLLLLSIFPSIRIFSNELAPRIRWSFNFSISLSNEYSGLIYSPYVQFSFFKQNHEGQKVCFLFFIFHATFPSVLRVYILCCIPKGSCFKIVAAV